MEVGERASQNKFPHSQLPRADHNHGVSLRFELIKWVCGQLTSCVLLVSGPTSKVTLMKTVDELVWADSQMLGC